MDNLTHSLVGIAMAETALRLRGVSRSPESGEQAAKLRKTALLASLFANNLPDLDLVYYWVTPGHLGTLLHHRGHTHTALLALPQALLAAWLALAFTRGKTGTPAPLGLSDKLWLACLSVLGVLMHVFMDTWNSYGTHPYWPFSNRWVFADFAFLFEPCLWAVLIPFLFHTTAGHARSPKAWRGLLLFLFAGGLVFPWLAGFVPAPNAAALAILGISLFFCFRAARESRRLPIAAAALCAVLAAFWVTSLRVRGELEAIARADAATAKLHDVVLSPLPANPFCWFFVTVQTSGADYVLRRGIVSAAPSLVPAESCPMFRFEGPFAATTPVRPSGREKPGQIAWRGEFRAPLEELKKFQREDCRVAAFLRFSRAPYWRTGEGNRTVFGDMRFDQRKSRGFSHVALDPPDATACPPNVPAWKEPLAEVLAR